MLKVLRGACESKRGRGAGSAASSPGLRQPHARQEELVPSQHVSSGSLQHVGHSSVNPSRLRYCPVPRFGFHRRSGGLARGLLGYLQMDGVGTSRAPGPTGSPGSSPLCEAYPNSPSVCSAVLWLFEAWQRNKSTVFLSSGEKEPLLGVEAARHREC